MALGTNYKRNQDKSDNAIASRIAKAKEIAKELNGNLELASAVVLGRKTMEQAVKDAAK